ncbi:BamA/TamA family outer membrane protein [Aerosakkonemataceae cyanobacterium BLCC-F154]|uniref:BamA/TamA family outer membrane protein n=1 Tax=Floridaenema fluviatile BLCC-F154 TaxID=3153640 RepID=A0ABV4YKU3_9CYAN
MPISNKPFIQSLFVILGATSANLFLITASWSQDLSWENSLLEASYFDRLADRTLEKFSTNAADLLSDASESQIRETAQNTPNNNAQPGTIDRRFNIPLSQRNNAFSFGFGSILGEPTILNGPTRKVVVAAESTTLPNIAIAGYLQQRIGDNQRVVLEAVGGLGLLGVDLSYSIAPTSLPGVFSLNVFSQQSRVPAFAEGEREVELPGGDEPWVDRLGGGIEYSQSLAPQLQMALGFNYQRVAIRDGAFTSDVSPRDEFGNPLSFSNDGIDVLLTLNFAGLYDTTDNPSYATSGSRIKFGVDQSIPVGDSSITYTRFAANLSQFFPVKLLNFTEGPQTFILNFQAGTMLGDVPPYEAFILGGSSSIRGYSKGEVTTSRSFIQATAEYRFPIFSFTALSQPFDVSGSVFVDYGSDLGTADNVTGEPGVVRDKPGDGWGYGFGFNARSSFGLIRLEFAWNDRGGNEIFFVIGDRF